MANAVLDEVLAGRPAGQSLDEFERLMDELEAARQLKTKKLEVARRLIDHALTAPADMRRAWQQIIRQPIDEVMSLRDKVRAMLVLRLELAETALQVAPVAAELAGGPLDGADHLPGARHELARFVELIVPRWKTQEDLEELIVETIELPEWVRKGPVPAHLRPPQSWWDDEDDDPFQPLPDQP